MSQAPFEQAITFLHAADLEHRRQIYHCFAKDPDGYLLEIQRVDQPLE